MRALFVILGAVVMLIGVATQPASAGKGSEIEQFLKRVGKFAIDQGSAQKPRGLCVCQDGSLNHTRAGVLAYNGQLGDAAVIVRCVVSAFNLDGAVVGASACDTFEVLSK